MLITARTDKSFTSHTSVRFASFFSSLSRISVYEKIDLPGGDGVTLLTADRVLTFGTKKLRLSWDLPLTQVKRVINEDHGIRFVHKTGKDLDKLILIDDKKSQAWFYEQIAGVVKAFNARRRMDS
jgi:vacuolar protein sorting-associated protein 13A/C